MGARSLPRIAEGLLAAGKHPDTPAAVVANGTRSDQEVVTSTLAEIADAAASVPTPALIVIGEVVSLAEAIGPAQRHYGAAALARR
jgi:siroheme synthase